MVAQVQRLLRYAGFYAGAVDDDYGRLTFEAVKAYQAGQLWPTLVPDGDWGPATAGHAEWVGDLQEALNGWRTSLPRLRVDHDYGDLTFERVREWQRRNLGGAYPYYCAIDGKAGPITCKALGVPAPGR